MHLKRSRPMIIQYVPSHFAFIDLNKECSFNLARKAAIFIITRHKPLSTHHCVILRNLGQSTSHIFIECNAINLFWQISCSAQYESWLLFRNMQVRKYECQKWLLVTLNYYHSWIWQGPIWIELKFSWQILLLCPKKIVW